MGRSGESLSQTQIKWISDPWKLHKWMQHSQNFELSSSRGKLTVRSELLILPGAAQMCWGQVPVPPGLHGLQVLETHQRQSDLRVPRRAVLRTPKVYLLARGHDHGEIHKSSLVLHAVYCGHALEAELLGFGAPRRARSISAAAAAFAAVQPQPFLCEDAALLFPQLEEPAAALLQQPVPHHLDRERHGHAEHQPPETRKVVFSWGASQDESIKNASLRQDHMLLSAEWTEMNGLDLNEKRREWLTDHRGGW